jgi:hypothetical protein
LGRVEEKYVRWNSEDIIVLVVAVGGGGGGGVLLSVFISRISTSPRAAEAELKRCGGDVCGIKFIFGIAIVGKG